jgi:hypothetical protein
MSMKKVLFSGLEAWGKYPLGILPWQNEQSVLQLELPRDTVWKRVIN